MKMIILVIRATVGLLIGSFCFAAEIGTTNQASSSVVNTNQVREVGTNMPILLLLLEQTSTNLVGNTVLEERLGALVTKEKPSLWDQVVSEDLSDPDGKMETQKINFAILGAKFQYESRYPISTSAVEQPSTSLSLIVWRKRF